MKRALAAVALCAGLFAAVAGDPYRVRRGDAGVARLAGEIAQERDHVTAIELAQMIRDHKAGLRVIDLRSEAEFASYHLPRAERMPIESIGTVAFDPRETIVLISDGGAHAAQAWVLLETLGHRNVYFLRGGLGEWLDDIMRPTKPTDLTRYFGGTPRGDDEGFAQTPRDTESNVSRLRRNAC